MKLLTVLTIITLNIIPFTLSDSECVRTIQALEDALGSASEGDSVVICDGDYEDWDILMDTKGLTLSAATPGKVSLHLGSRVTVTGRDNKLSGLKFHGGGSKTPINISGERNTVSDCVVEHHQAPHWLNILGRENTVRNCRFSNKTAKVGRTILAFIQLIISLPARRRPAVAPVQSVPNLAPQQHHQQRLQQLPLREPSG